MNVWKKKKESNIQDLPLNDVRHLQSLFDLPDARQSRNLNYEVKLARLAQQFSQTKAGQIWTQLDISSAFNWEENKAKDYTPWWV